MSVRAAAVRGVRAALGKRDVNLTPDYMGFGNHLYLWVWAYARRHERVSPKVLMTEKMRYWADLVPEFSREFIVEPADVRRTDRRGSYFAHPDVHSSDPRGFTDSERSAFIRQALCPEPLLRDVGEGPLAADDSLVVNVRRGDFYAAENLAVYGFDVASYVRLAVERNRDEVGAVRRIHVVSDDLEWCRRHLPWLADLAKEVTTPDAGSEPAAQFRDVASARRIVMTNSTFSIWAAAVSNEIHGDNAKAIWAPAFFQTVYGPGRCHEYDSQWSFVDDLPNGWQPTWLLDGHESPG